jgi:HEAT repeat protein
MQTANAAGTAKDTGESVPDLMAALKAYDWGGDRGTLMGIDARIADAGGDKEKLAEIEQALLDVVQSDVPLPAKEYACRQLALVGTSRCVPTLAAMLSDAEMSDRARFALEAIPGPTVNGALRAALNTAEGMPQVGIVNTLGERRDKEAIPMLEEMRDSADGVLSEAIDRALRKIAEPR